MRIVVASPRRVGMHKRAMIVSGADRNSITVIAIHHLHDVAQRVGKLREELLEQRHVGRGARMSCPVCMLS